MMAKDTKALFQTLLQQIKLSPTEDVMVYLEEGEIKSVWVHKNEKKWKFDLSFNVILAFKVIKQIEEALSLALIKIAKTELEIEVKNQTINQQLISDYWLYACQQSGVDSPICNELFNTGTPILKDNKVY